MSSEKVTIFRHGDIPEEMLNLDSLQVKACECVSGNGTDTEVFKLLFEGEDFYLKISKKQRLVKLLPRLIKAKKWCSTAELEAHVLDKLNGAGFETIPVVAGGTVYKKFMPVMGYMLSKAIAGIPLETVLTGNDEKNEELWRRYGVIAARLHDFGCFEPLRAKDILISGDSLYLLDREKPIATSSGATEKKRVRSLRRAFYRNQRSGLKVSKVEFGEFMKGYIGVSGNGLRITEADILPSLTA